MRRWNGQKGRDALLAAAPELPELARSTRGSGEFRVRLSRLVARKASDAFEQAEVLAPGAAVRIRDCARALQTILTRRSESLAGFSVAGALRTAALGWASPELTPAFLADVAHLFSGLTGGEGSRDPGAAYLVPSRASGRAAARVRSDQLDRLHESVQARIRQIPCGLDCDAVERRVARSKAITGLLGGSDVDWRDWRWQLANVVTSGKRLERLVCLRDEEAAAIENAGRHRLPFGVTPYYLSLMDDDPEAGRDRAVRAQVFPPASYVDVVGTEGTDSPGCRDFMLEGDTSPIDLITRRYPDICIFKPFNTCPQICVYCQRNWEIRRPMEEGALAPPAKLDAAIAWIAAHPALREILVTGGDPLALQDDPLFDILERIAAIPHVERIRVGSRVLVTLPMRVTRKLAAGLGRLRSPGRLSIALVTHVQHPYEVTPELVTAVERLRHNGIPVYNQLVYTYFVSRRFEAAALRQLLVRCGIEPYYTFNLKGKDETADYRVPVARLLQEQKEEARLLPGLERTDEAVFNVPGFGKNYLRAVQHRDLIAVLPDGSRLYEFHPWEKNISPMKSTYLFSDVPILDYLQRLERDGEDVLDYETIWYYF